MPWAAVLYGCDAKWWRASGPDPGEFTGERWASHSLSPRKNDDKRAAAAEHGLTLIEGAARDGFSMDPARLHYGDNSGFQAINLAILFGATRIWLLGFDMRVNGRRHFFGDHPAACHKASDYRQYIGHFETAARLLPPGIEIINATPDSALHCFPRGEI